MIWAAIISGIVCGFLTMAVPSRDQHRVFMCMWGFWFVAFMLFVTN